jgi:predicted Fe-Mo cluster-binding NifX family protein
MPVLLPGESAHFGRCREFLIFEAVNGQVKLVGTRINAGCHHTTHSSDTSDRRHSHAGFIELLKDCGTVLCSGIGAGAVAALRTGGIPLAIVDAAGSAEKIVVTFQSGALLPSTGGTCQCRH